mgnify:CR=1 FL=1
MIDDPIVVFWSGGYDSTLSLLRYIKQGRDILAVSIESQNTGEVKLAAEKSSRLKIQPLLHEYSCMYGAHVEYISYPLLDVDTSGVSIAQFDNAYMKCNGYQGSIKRSSRQRIVQPLLWLSGLYAISPFLPERCKIAFSYISSDCAVAYNSYIASSVENAGLIQRKHFELVEPLLMLDKEDVLQELHKEYPNIFEYCYSCESLYHEGPCSSCHPCLTIIQAVSSMLLQHISEEDRAFWTTFLRDRYQVVLERVYNDKEELKYDGSD